MWGAIIAGVTSLVNMAVNAGVTATSTKKKVQAYKNAAEQIKNATNKYSGSGLNSRMTAAGESNMAKNGSLYFDPTWKGNGANTNAMAAFNQSNNNIKNTNPWENLYSQGSNAESTLNNAKWNAENTKVQQALKQADIDYNADIQTGKAIANGVSNVANTIGQFGGWGGISNGNGGNNGK